MDTIDKYRRSNERRETPAPATGYTWEEIKSDKVKNNLFLEMLGINGYKNIAERLAGGKIEKDEFAIFREQLAVFAKKMLQAEKMEKILDTDNIDDLAQSNPDLAQIKKDFGAERVIEAINSQLKRIAITDESRFNDMVSKMGQYDDYRKGKYKEVKDEVKKLCEDNNITSEEYLAAVAIKDPAAKKEALKKLATKDYGKFDKALNFLSGGYLSGDTLKSLQDSEYAYKDQISKLGEYEKDVARVLFSSATGNEDMMNALINTKAPEKQQSGFMDAKRETTIDEVQLQKDWKAKKKTIANWSQLVPAVQNEQKEKFLKEQKEAYKAKVEKKGGWYRFFAALIEPLFDSREDELKGKLE